MRRDVRTVRTEQAIREAFVKLVEEHGYARVTVKEICTLADINRNTFYLHYTDKESLVQHMFDRVISDQAKPLAAAVSRVSTAGPEAVEEIVRSILGVMAQEMEFYRILFTDEELYKYIVPLEKTAYSMIVAGSTRPVSRVALEYIIHGFVGVTVAWIRDAGQTVDEIAPTLTGLLLDNLGRLHAPSSPGASQAPHP